MKLRNPFPEAVRNLYVFYEYRCGAPECGHNGTMCGGMELHHILGRCSDSALNSVPLCHCCHEHCGHNANEEISLLKATWRFLKSIGYVLKPVDRAFMQTVENKYPSFSYGVI